MNEVNKIVFDVYKNLIDSNYNKNQKHTIIGMISKLIRYILSGYILEISHARKKMNQINVFHPSDRVYNKKVVVYTICFGNYDNIRNPIYINDEYDYFIFTDQLLPENIIWKRIDLKDVNSTELSNIEKSRFPKIMPHLFFKDYDYSVYIDSNILITCNIDEIINTMIENKKSIAMHKHQVRDCVYKEAKAVYASGKAKWKDINNQVEFYSKQGFPKRYGLFENNIIFRKHNDKECIEVMELWWSEFSRFATKRDQLSFMYSLWRNGFTADFIMSLGNNSRRNPYFIVRGHN